MNIWLQGVVAAAVSGAASAIGAMVIDPLHFNLANLDHLEGIALGGAILGVSMFLKQSPLPKQP